MSNTHGKTVKLYYEQGNHDGIINAEMMNWTGFAVAAPRTSLAALYQLEEVRGAGIYFLISDDDKKVYVGETMNGIQRMKDHDERKDFWDTLVLVQTKDFNLTKTHCSYLEHRCARIIEKDSLFSLENSKSLSDYTGTLPRSAINDMEVFLENLRFILPAMGITILQNLSFTKNEQKVAAEFVLKVGDVDGEVYLQEEQLILKKGSVGNTMVKKSLYESIKNRREILIEKGILKIEGEKIIVQEDFKVSSLSTAACYLTGYPISGPQNWKLKGTKLPYKEWEKQQLKG